MNDDLILTDKAKLPLLKISPTKQQNFNPESTRTKKTYAGSGQLERWASCVFTNE